VIGFRVVLYAFVSGLVLLMISNDTTAFADTSPNNKQCHRGVCYVEARRPPAEGSARSVTPTRRNGSSGTAGDRQRAQTDLKTRIAASEAASSRYMLCISAAFMTGRDAGSCRQPAPPLTSGDSVPASNGPPAQLITPAQAGAITAARLKIPTVAPGIGPSPDLNRWNMAAVGYPLWLWADGPTQVGPVSDSVAGLSVSLRAEVTSLTFRMGDGTTVTCSGAGDQWTRAVEPGTKAPSCGHTYTKPSLPKGNYKVAALTEWAVTWTANGQSGVINVPAVQTTDLPVGELQVLVR
jgi:hypothetical protein